MDRRPMIGVIGGSECSPEVQAIAVEVGFQIARKGGILVCGGLGGVMEAAAMGAKKGGGSTIGILPQEKTDLANPYIDFPIATGMGYARNILIVNTADVLIAIAGKYGTLSEVAYGLIQKKPVISLGSWEVDPTVLKANNSQEAVDLAFRSIAKHLTYQNE